MRSAVLSLALALGCAGSSASPLVDRCLALCERAVDCGTATSCSRGDCSITVLAAASCNAELTALYDCGDGLACGESGCDTEAATLLSCESASRDAGP